MTDIQSPHKIAEQIRPYIKGFSPQTAIISWLAALAGYTTTDDRCYADISTDELLSLYETAEREESLHSRQPEQIKQQDLAALRKLADCAARKASRVVMHIIFSKYATTGDGILTSLKVMEVILEKKASLAALASEVKIYPQLLQNLRVQDMDAVLNAPSVQKAIAEVEERLGTEGRVLVRKSGTEPLLRVMVEAQTDELCEENVLHIINAMKGV